MGIVHAGLELYLCREKAFQMEVNSVTLPYYQKAEKNDEFTPAYRAILRRKIMRYYLENPADRMRGEYLESIDAHEFAEADLKDAAALLIGQGMYGKAFSIVSEQGYEQIPEDQLMILCSEMIRKREQEKDEDLLRLAEYVFRKGRYDEQMICYLRDHADGSVSYLCGIREHLKEFGLDSADMDKRILRQAAETEEFPGQSAEIISNVLEQGGEDVLVGRCLEKMSLMYFPGGKELPAGIPEILEKRIAQGLETGIPCKLALLRYFMAAGNTDEAQQALAAKLVRQMDENGLRFAFYRKLPENVLRGSRIMDRFYLEGKFPPESRVMLHYRLEGDRGPGKWVSEPLRNLYHGIFSKEIILFYGEKILFFFSVSREGDEQKTETRQFSIRKLYPGGTAKYQLLNRMLKARADGNRESLQKNLREYLYGESYVSKFLKMIES